MQLDWVWLSVFLFAELALSFSCRSSPSDPFVCSFRLFEGQHLLPQASQSCSSPQCRIRSYGLSVSQFSLAASSNKGRIGRKTHTPYSPFRNGMLCHNCHVSILHNPFCLASPGGAELHCWAMFSHFQTWSSCVYWQAPFIQVSRGFNRSQKPVLAGARSDLAVLHRLSGTLKVADAWALRSVSDQIISDHLTVKRPPVLPQWRLWDFHSCLCHLCQCCLL